MIYISFNPRTPIHATSHIVAKTVSDTSENRKNILMEIIDRLTP